MAHVDVAAKPPVRNRDGRSGALTLAVVLTGTFVVVLDFFIVNVAVPSMQRELGASSAETELVVAGYGLAYASGLITAGRLGDVFGRRRLYVTGLALFTAASLACGAAPTAAALVAARVVQGVAAAVLAPQVLTILSVARSGAARARGFTAYGVVLATASMCGQLVGGLLIQADVAGLGWRSCFLINVPIGLPALLLARRAVPESRSGSAVRLDPVGAVLVTAGLAALVLPLVVGREAGWPGWSRGCLVLCVLLLAVFVRHQHRLRARGGSPLVDLAVFRERAFTAGLGAVFAFYLGLASFFLVLALYLQQGRGMGALAAGAAFTPVAGGFFVTSLAARRLERRLGRQALALGGVLVALGQGLLLLAVSRNGTGGDLGELVPGLLLDGAGMGLVMAPLNAAVSAALPARLAGTASGVLTTVMQVGNALGVALVGLVFYGAAGTGRARTALGLERSLACLVVLGAVLAAAVQLLPRTRTRAVSGSE